MATSTNTPTVRQLEVHDNGGWASKTVTCNTIGELRVALDIPDNVQINISDTLFTENTAEMPVNKTAEDGSVIPLFVGWQANNKTGGTK
jgi:hypothetical protein